MRATKKVTGIKNNKCFIFIYIFLSKWFRHSILALVATIFKSFYIFLQIYKKNILSVEKLKLFILFNNISLFA